MTNLNINGLAGFTVYLVGSNNWDDGYVYNHEKGAHTIEIDPETVGDQFKHYVLCDMVSANEIRNTLIERSDIIVTGNGDVVLTEEGVLMYRCWFLLDGKPTIGEDVWKNNTW